MILLGSMIGREPKPNYRIIYPKQTDFGGLGIFPLGSVHVIGPSY